VRSFGVVGGAGDGEFLVCEPEGVGGAGEDERERLAGLGRGAGVDVGLRVAHGVEDVAARVADDDASPVDALEERAAPDGGERTVLRQADATLRETTHRRA
jgi:hypothetical protein